MSRWFWHFFSQARARGATHHASGAPAAGLSTLTAGMAVTVDLNIAIGGRLLMVAVQVSIVIAWRGVERQLSW